MRHKNCVLLQFLLSSRFWKFQKVAVLIVFYFLLIRKKKVDLNANVWVFIVKYVDFKSPNSSKLSKLESWFNQFKPNKAVLFLKVDDYGLVLVVVWDTTGLQPAAPGRYPSETDATSD